MNVRAIFAELACLLSLACASDRVTTEIPFLAVPVEGWSGGTAMIVSPSFAGADTLPAVTVGGRALAVRWLGDAAVQVQLPDTNGSITLEVRLRSGGRTTAPILVRGFAGVNDGPALDADARLYPWPVAGVSTALALRQGRLVQVNLGALTVSGPLAPDTGLGCPTPGSQTYGIFAPVPSATVPGLATAVACGVGANMLVLAVPVAPSAAAPDTGPLTGAEVAVHLARGRWLVSIGNPGLVVFTRNDSGTFTQSPATAWEALGAVVSPRGDRIAPAWTKCGIGAGVPVYDSSGAVAFRVADFPCTSGPAAFSPDGSTLYEAGIDSAYRETLVAVDAGSGAVLARAVRFADVPYQNRLPTSGLAADPDRPFLYAAGWHDGLFLDVLDRETLEPVASLRAPAAVTSALDPLRVPASDLWTIVVDGSARRLYVVPSDYASTRQPYVFSYDLMH